MKSLKALVAVVLLATLVGVGQADTARVYRGPANELPAAWATPGSDGVLGVDRLASRSRMVEGLTRWEFWWETNRSSYLRAARGRLETTSPDSPSAAVWAHGGSGELPVVEEASRQRIVSLLLEKLADRDPEMRARAALALGRARAAKALPRLKEMLLRGGETDRQAAAVALGSLGVPEVVPILADFLKLAGVPAGQRAWAALGLGLSDSRAAGPVLRSTLTAVLVGRGEEVEELQSACATALGLLQDRGAITLLVRIAGNHSGRQDFVRSAAILALGRIGDGAALPALLAALQDNDVDARRVAAQALGLLGSEQANPALMHAFEADGDVQVRNFAAIALARIGGSGVGDLLVAGLDRKNPRAVRGFSALALGLTGELSRAAALRPLLELPDESSLMGAAVMGLSLLGDTASLPRFRAIAGDENRDDDLRGYAVLACAMLGDPVSRGAVLGATRTTGSANLRRAGMTSLALYPEPWGARAVLGGLLEEADPYVRGAAIESLGLLPRGAVVDPLLTVAEERGFSAVAAKDAVAALGVLAAEGQPSPLERFLSEAAYRSLSKAESALLMIF